MAALGVLADAAAFLGIELPAEIAEPAACQTPGGEWIEFEEFTSARELVEAIGEGQCGTDDLLHGIEWVNRYLDLPAVQARSY